MNIAHAITQSITANIQRQRKTGTIASWRDTNILRVFDYLITNNVSIPLSLQKYHLISVATIVKPDTTVRHSQHILPSTEVAYEYSNIIEELNTQPICQIFVALRLP